MASNDRLILTRDPVNRIMVEKPAGYDPAKLAAAVQAAESRQSPPTGERRGDALQQMWERL